MERVCKRRRPHVLRSVSDRCLTRRGPPARASPQGRQSGGNPGAATHEVRARHQPENSAAAWACDSAIAACPRRRSHRVTLAIILLHLLTTGPLTLLLQGGTAARPQLAKADAAPSPASASLCSTQLWPPTSPAKARLFEQLLLRPSVGNDKFTPHRLDTRSSARSPTQVRARSAAALSPAAASPRTLYTSASPKYDQPLAGARLSARWNWSSASARRPACSSAAASDWRTG